MLNFYFFFFNYRLAALGRGRGRGTNGTTNPTAGTVPGAMTYDSFSGYKGEQLFANDIYEADDAEADRIYAEIDERMENNKNKRKREEDEQTKTRLDNTRLTGQFQDLKRELGTLTEQDWESLQEIGDRSLKHKEKKWDYYTPVPDTLLTSTLNTNQNVNAIDPRFHSSNVGNTSSSSSSSSYGVVTDIKSLSEARGQMLNMKLNKVSDSITGQSVIDPTGYLTAMNSNNTVLPNSDIADIKRVRLLLKSVITTNPKNGHGWIAAARLEEQVRNIAEARKLIKEGCTMCPDDEDVWLEAARLQPEGKAKLVLAEAVRYLPRSIKLWTIAADYETGTEEKKAVLRKALTLIPNSETLWKAAIALEEPEDARIMLARAVECVPKCLDLWLGLARLENYDNARKVLNDARIALPSEPLVWITAARLEETQQHDEMVDKIITRALKSLASQQVIIDRETWIHYAEDTEKAQAPVTCATIIRHVLDIGVEEIDRRRTWMSDAEALENRGSIITARAVYARLLSEFANKDGIWLRAAEFEKKHGTPDNVDALLRKAVLHCPQTEILWLMAAKEKWLLNKVTEARVILGEAFHANPDSELIWLAAIKLEWETGEYERAQILLTKAREQVSSPRVWMKSAMLERELHNDKEEETFLVEGLRKYSTYPKLWMMLGQFHERRNNLERARETYQAALRICPTSLPLWKLTVLLEERMYGIVKARTLLETARIKNPKSPMLWLESIRLEHRHHNEKQVESLLARGLQECPTSGLLLAEDIDLAPRPLQKRKSIDALQKADTDPYVVLSVAKLFWHDRKYDKAQKWFERATSLNPDLGDSWIWWYYFEIEQGNEGLQRDIEEKCKKAEPKHGELWQSIAKVPENRKCKVNDILRMGVISLRNEENRKRHTAMEQHEGITSITSSSSSSSSTTLSSSSSSIKNNVSNHMDTNI